MKKIAMKIMVSLLIISLFGPSLGLYKAKADSKTIYVDDDNFSGPWMGTQHFPYKNITNGLSAAMTGDTVYVYSGIYFEQLIISESISLVGESGKTIIDGNKTGDVIHIVADTVTIKQFTIQNSGKSFDDSGIRIHMGKNHTIVDNIIVGSSRGIFALNSMDNIISGNNISYNNEGIYLVDSSNNTITSNEISNNDFGMFMRSCNGSI